MAKSLIVTSQLSKDGLGLSRGGGLKWPMAQASNLASCSHWPWVRLLFWRPWSILGCKLEADQQINKLNCWLTHMRSQSSHPHIQLMPTQAHVQISGPTVKPHKHHSNCCHCYQVDLHGFKLQSIAESKQIFTLKSSCSLPFVPTLTHGSQIHHVEHNKRQSFTGL